MHAIVGHVLIGIGDVIRRTELYVQQFVAPFTHTVVNRGQARSRRKQIVAVQPLREKKNH